jgi:hypothetical protein
VYQFQIQQEMLFSLGKAQDRLEFLQAKNIAEDDDEMVVVCHNVHKLSVKYLNRFYKN